MTSSQMKEETNNDSKFQKLLQAIKTSHWSNPEIQLYTNVKDERTFCSPRNTSSPSKITLTSSY